MRKEKLKLQTIKISSFVTASQERQLLGGAIDAASRKGKTVCAQVGCTFNYCTGPRNAVRGACGRSKNC
ncbi:MAG: hypothetical protein QNK37_34130 [Acidobacteriota bacterium]|nr:hypothetical protein [Acidobacteriota bacterium]